MRTQTTHSLIGPKGTVLIGQNGVTLANKDVDGDITAQLWMGKASVLLDEILFQELLNKGWLTWQEHSAKRQFQGRRHMA